MEARLSSQLDSINLQNNLRVGDGKRIISQGCEAEHRNSFAICFGLLQHFLGYLTWTQLTLALQQHFSLRPGQTKPAALIWSTWSWWWGWFAETKITVVLKRTRTLRTGWAASDTFSTHNPLPLLAWLSLQLNPVCYNSIASGRDWSKVTIRCLQASTGDNITYMVAWAVSILNKCRHWTAFGKKA